MGGGDESADRQTRGERHLLIGHDGAGRPKDASVQPFQPTLLDSVADRAGVEAEFGKLGQGDEGVLARGQGADPPVDFHAPQLIRGV